MKSYLGWWAEAGLIDPASDTPFHWLAPLESGVSLAAVAAPRPADQPTARAIAPAIVPARTSLPTNLADFDRWIAEASDFPGRDWSIRPVLPSGPVNAPLMLLGDAPDPGDIEVGRLFSGAQGKLVDAMLAAIGLTRDACRIGSIALTRPIGGRLDGPDAERLSLLARHHIALARPRSLLLVGQQSAQLIAGEGISPQPRQLGFNHEGVTVAAFAVHHPRLLLERPLLKRTAWDVLKRVREQF